MELAQEEPEITQVTIKDSSGTTTVRAKVIKGIVLMDNEPTSENLSISLMTWLNGWLPSGLFCVAVRWEETESSSAEVSI